MPDLDDLILTLDRLHDVLGERPAFWRTTTGIEVTQAIQHYRSREHLTDPADRAPDNAATLVAYKAAIVRAYVRPPIGKSTGDAVGRTLLVERQDGIFGAYSTVTTPAPWLWPLAALFESPLEPLDLAVDLAGAPGPDVGFEHERDPRPERQHGLSGGLHDREDLVPLPLDLGEHRRRAVRQTRSADDLHRGGDRVVHRSVGALGDGGGCRGGVGRSAARGDGEGDEHGNLQVDRTVGRTADRTERADGAGAGHTLGEGDASAAAISARRRAGAGSRATRTTIQTNSAHTTRFRRVSTVTATGSGVRMPAYSNG